MIPEPLYRIKILKINGMIAFCLCADPVYFIYQLLGSSQGKCRDVYNPSIIQSPAKDLSQYFNSALSSFVISVSVCGFQNQ